MRYPCDFLVLALKNTVVHQFPSCSLFHIYDQYYLFAPIFPVRMKRQLFFHWYQFWDFVFWGIDFLNYMTQQLVSLKQKNIYLFYLDCHCYSLVYLDDCYLTEQKYPHHQLVIYLREHHNHWEHYCSHLAVSLAENIKPVT